MSSNQDQLKKEVARAGLELIENELHRDQPIGVGTGSTMDLFIDMLGAYRHLFAGAVASSERSAQRLVRQNVKVFELNDVAVLPLYVDGADELTSSLTLLKGGGGALTREKIVAAAARRFVCIVDASKLVERHGAFPLPVEVIPMARSYVTRCLIDLCGPGVTIRLRLAQDGSPLITDNGNLILDIIGFEILDPLVLEAAIDGLAGVVSNGLFAHRGADIALVGGSDGIRSMLPPANRTPRHLPS